MIVIFFFFNDTATTEIYTLSLHDALPILATTMRGRRPLVLAAGGERVRWLAAMEPRWAWAAGAREDLEAAWETGTREDRKSTRLNSSHANISYAVFCLKKT